MRDATTEEGWVLIRMKSIYGSCYRCKGTGSLVCVKHRVITEAAAVVCRVNAPLPWIIETGRWFHVAGG